ncbi:PEP/pyruvate-binding domain-containing protein [Undibacterium cyanobacteriorum]|uniref:PEP/pyruvate-binding domain-containing protein n=1 Tax=Undibacterium cyanobacteriorum TaxID=3073561 RepID=A0ABY9RDA3_9BURK|nr:PEP/pyruvate-binding domain-containing protein [Undibacterium sp. 20NA77.5]WMW79222.1 PEP/pyruvate-binding domain-containing protein [Undibacterium sp. 20NA77.5]
MSTSHINLTAYNWVQAWELGAHEVGGKAAQLAALARYGLPSAEGFVLKARDCRQLFNPELWKAAIEASEQHDWAALEETKNALMQSANEESLIAHVTQLLEARTWTSTALAVRSSAPGEDSQQASFAGIHETVLHVIGLEAVCSAIIQVIASIWTPAAALYREKVKMPHQAASMAVVLMPMLKAQSAGVIFTRHPRSGREDQLLISAVAGLADKLVAGLTDGEDIVIQRDWSCMEWEVIERRSSNDVVRNTENRTASTIPLTHVLSDQDAIRLAQIALQTAYAFDYSSPFLDIEWVFDGYEFTLVQARPITHKVCHSYSAIREQGFIWTRGNTREILPYPVTVSETTVMQNAVNHMLAQPHRVVGHKLLEGVQRIAFFHGHAYLNASLIQWEIYHGFGLAPEVSNFVIGGHQESIEVPKISGRERLQMLMNMAKAALLYNSARNKGLQEVQQVEAEAKTWSTAGLREMPDTALLEELGERSVNTYRHRSGMCMMQGASGSLLELRKRIIAALPDHLKLNADAITAALMTDGDTSVSAQQAYDMLRLAQLAARDDKAREFLQQNSKEYDVSALGAESLFREAYENFMYCYGHRGNYESYVSRPSWREDPRELHQSILGLLQADENTLRSRQNEQQIWAQRIIKQHFNLAQRILLRVLSKQAKQECNQRELARSTFAKLLERCRYVLIELGRRLQARQILNRADEIFHLTVEEIRACFEHRIDTAAIQFRVQDRIKKVSEWQQQNIPDLIYEGQISKKTQASKNAITKSNTATDSDCWPGIAISMASYEGIVRKITHPDQIEKLQQGEIMLAPSTDPSWLGLFLKAGGVIVETGGYLSHSAIVARELGIPTIVNIPGIMAQIEDGDFVKIDGENSCLIRSNRH